MCEQFRQMERYTWEKRPKTRGLFSSVSCNDSNIGNAPKSHCRAFACKRSVEQNNWLSQNSSYFKQKYMQQVGTYYYCYHYYHRRNIGQLSSNVYCRVHFKKTRTIFWPFETVMKNISHKLFQVSLYHHYCYYYYHYVSYKNPIISRIYGETESDILAI